MHQGVRGKSAQWHTSSGARLCAPRWPGRRVRPLPLGFRRTVEFQFVILFGLCRDLELVVPGVYGKAFVRWTRTLSRARVRCVSGV